LFDSETTFKDLVFCFWSFDVLFKNLLQCSLFATALQMNRPHVCLIFDVLFNSLSLSVHCSPLQCSLFATALQMNRPHVCLVFDVLFLKICFFVFWNWNLMRCLEIWCAVWNFDVLFKNLLQCSLFATALQMNRPHVCLIFDVLFNSLSLSVHCSPLQCSLFATALQMNRPHVCLVFDVLFLKICFFVFWNWNLMRCLEIWCAVWNFDVLFKNLLQCSLFATALQMNRPHACLIFVFSLSLSLGFLFWNYFLTVSSLSLSSSLHHLWKIHRHVEPEADRIHRQSA
jgi:hypothetical protein